MTKHKTSFAQDVEEVRSSKEQFMDTIDRMKFSHKIPTDKVKLAKIKVNHAEAIITGRPMGDKKELSIEDMQNLIRHIAQFGDGTRQIMVLQLNEDHTGITDLISNKQYFFK